MTPLTLALDIGNVCIAIDPTNATRRIEPDLLPTFREVALRFECGKISEEEFFLCCREMRKNAPSPEECKAIFNSILLAPVPGMNELVSRFPELGVRAVFFSDISVVHLARTRELFPAARFVPEGVYSYEVGAMKPSELMLKTFERRFGRPDLYVDDRQDLIDAAVRFGWNAVRFTGAEELARLLERYRNNPCSPSGDI